MPETTTHSIDIEHLTVIAVDAHGEAHDLNALGEPCKARGDLACLIADLYEQGAYSRYVRNELLWLLVEAV